MTERLDTAVAAARAGGAVAREQFRTGLAVDRKRRDTDFVTAADRAAQHRVVEVIREDYPDAVVIGEEDGLDGPVPESGPAWIVDPIDGTNNFVRGTPIWATSVAAVVDGETVASANVMPSLGDAVVADRSGVDHDGEPATVSDREVPRTFEVGPLLWWEYEDREAFAAVCRGIVTNFDDLRRYGAAQYSLSAVATGALDAVVATEAAPPWDTVAGVHQIRAAGGVVTTPAGEPWTWDSEGLVASNGRAHEAVLAAVPEG